MSSTIMPTYARAPLAFSEGKGCWLTEEGGEQYLDFGGGIAVALLGHAHPKLVSTLKRQAERLWHASNLYRIPDQERLGAMLVEHSFADKVFFANSGAEANEAAVKLARRYWFTRGESERYEIITLEKAFHGRTLGMISAVGSEKLTEGFGPLSPGFVQVPPDDLEAMKAAISERTAAILVEPVLGEGGIVPLSDQYMRFLRATCDEHGLLLLMDEVQCGMGRTGRLFAHEWSGITPDVMAIAKGIGGGFPIGACLATKEAASGMVAGTHGSTFGGNPLACAVGIAVMEVVVDEDFLATVRRRARDARQCLESIVASHSEIFEEVRGTGLMLGLKCKVSNADFVAAGYDQKLLTVPAGDNVVRLLPPLNVSSAEMSEAMERLEQAATSLEKELA